MSLATKRNLTAGKPTVKIDLAGSQLGGLGMDSSGYPYITDNSGNVVFGGISGVTFRTPVVVKTSWAGADNTNVQASIANPFAATCYVTKAWLDITTQQTGADGTVDIGVAANATTASDTLIDGGSDAAVGVIDSTKDAGTNGVSVQKMTSSQYITLKAASGTNNSKGAVGVLYAEFVLP